MRKCDVPLASRLIGWLVRGCGLRCPHPLFNWRCESSFSVPSKRIDTLANNIVGNTKVFSQLRHAAGDSENGKHAIGSFVSALLFCCRPVAILLTVMAIAIAPFNRMFGRWISHILKERSKVLPSLAHGYSATAVVVVMNVLGILAPLFHTAPDAINTRLGIANKCAVFDSPLVMGTTAGFVFWQGASSNGDNLFAFASAIPCDANSPSRSAVGFSFSDHCELSKCLSGEYNFRRHNNVSVVFSGGCPTTIGTRYAYYAETSTHCNSI